MIIWFQRHIFLSIIILILFLPCSNGYAFIPEGPQIISLAVEKIVEPVGITLSQKRKVYHGKKDQENLIEPEKTELSYIEMTEKLWFSYPGKFRSEAVTGNHDMICVESKGKFIKIIDEFIESKEKSLIDLYTDILLFRKPESLTKRLKASGVNINLSSLKRYEDKIYFVVGTPPTPEQPSSSLWVEKDSNFPERYTINKDGLFVDIFYKDWQKVSRTWYPMKIVIFLDGVLFSEASAEKFELEADFEKNLFNIKRLKSIFPESGNYENESGSLKNESNELEKSIMEFKKLYE